MAISSEYELRYMANAMTRARRLEAERESFHRELYRCINPASVQIDPMIPRLANDVESQVIRICEAKYRYEALIQKEYSRYDDWTKFLQQFTDTEQILLIRQLKKKKPITSKNISRLMRKVERLLQAYERDSDKARTIQAKEDYKRYSDSTQRFRSKSPVVTKQYLIRGEFMKLSDDTYQNYKERTGETTEFIM